MTSSDAFMSPAEFCKMYCDPTTPHRYVLGRNVYTASVMSQLPIDGVVDDFTAESEFGGVPVVKTTDLPLDAWVLNASGGRPFTAKAALDRLGLRNLDYFAFLRHAKLALKDVVFNEGFQSDYDAHGSEYDWIQGLLADEASRQIFQKLVDFRYSLDLRALTGFQANEPAQYFEDFLNLQPSGESFVDVGCFNGYNALEFARLSPQYECIQAFEPDPANFEKCAQSLAALPRVKLHPLGLSNAKAALRMSQGGSGSRISDEGDVAIHVDRLDDVLACKPTLIKMDIEGAECQALEGARQTIAQCHPRLAICVYHNVGDFYRIPRLVLSIRSDYDIYLRHYTESIYETVMFFIPRKG